MPRSKSRPVEDLWCQYCFSAERNTTYPVTVCKLFISDPEISLYMCSLQNGKIFIHIFCTLCRIEDTFHSLFLRYLQAAVKFTSKLFALWGDQVGIYIWSSRRDGELCTGFLCIAFHKSRFHCKCSMSFCDSM